MSAELEEIRRRTDEIDAQLMDLIEERVKLGEKAFEAKMRMGMQLYNEKRIETKLKWSEQEAKRRGLDEKDVRKIFEILVGMRMRRELRRIVEST